VTSAPSADTPSPDQRHRPAVRLDEVSLRYSSGAVALDGVSLRIDHGERVGVVGPSGVGKSSLINLLNGRVLVEGATVGGRLEVLGVDPLQLGTRARSRHAARVGTVRQALDLVGPMRVVHNVNAGRLGRWSTRRALWSLWSPREVDRVADALDAVGLDRSVLHARVDQLSGGQQQRVAVARLLVQAPELTLADEPVASLDPTLSEVVLALLAEPPIEPRWTLLVSVHQPELARRFVDRLIGMREGRIVFDAPAHTVDDDDLADLYRR
jgi:phosphonate transport system ATP-binding protein